MIADDLGTTGIQGICNYVTGFERYNYIIDNDNQI